MTWGALADDAARNRAAERAKRSASIVPTVEAAMEMARTAGHTAVDRALEAAKQAERSERESANHALVSAAAAVAVAREAIGAGAQVSAAQARTCAQRALASSAARGPLKQAVSGLEGTVDASLNVALQALETAASVLEDAAQGSSQSARSQLPMAAAAITHARNALRTGAKSGLDAALAAFQAASAEAPPEAHSVLVSAKSAVENALVFVASAMRGALEDAIHEVKIATHSLGSATPHVLNDALIEIRQSAAQREAIAAQLVQALDRAGNAFADAPFDEPLLAPSYTVPPSNEPLNQAQRQLRQLQYRCCTSPAAFLKQARHSLHIAAKHIADIDSVHLAAASDALDRALAGADEAARAELMHSKQSLGNIKAACRGILISITQAANAAKVSADQVDADLKPLVETALALLASKDATHQSAAPLAYAAAVANQVAEAAAEMVKIDALEQACTDLETRAQSLEADLDAALAPAIAVLTARERDAAPDPNGGSEDAKGALECIAKCSRLWRDERALAMASLQRAFRDLGKGTTGRSDLRVAQCA